jgi:hypothetical protein
MRLDRRTFLQQAALALVSAGVSETGINLLSKNARFARWLKPYVETLAQTTNRKLALLIGINEYSQKNNLHGCINDVELQKELLIYRFGFKAQDICLISDRQATRENIETAFLEHLSEQANSNDIVLFHFSGYGSQVKIADNSDSTQFQLVNSLVPVDASIPTKGKPAANDLLLDTLWALERSLNSSNLITVLDTSFIPIGEILQGNYRVRSYFEVAERPNAEELAFQAQIQRNLPGSRIASYFQFQTTPGTIITAAEQNQIALEGTWNNFSAGLLTYALTRYLWQTTPKTSIQIALQQTSNAVNNWSEKQQKPQISGKNNPILGSVVNAVDFSAGEGFIKGLDSKGMLILQLTALPLVLINSYRDESCFRVAEESAQELLQLRSLEGITAKAQLLSNNANTNKDALIGKLIQEAIRVLPRNLGLSVALDSHLERIERVDATSALANITSVKTAATAGEAYGDCLLGKIALMVDKTSKDNVQATEKPAHSYGLFTPKGNLIPNTPGEANEVVKLAVSRLEPYFNKLLAAKWLDLTINENSSTIPVSATLELVSKNSALVKKTALRAFADINSELVNNGIPNVERNSQIRLKIDNQSDRDLYGILMGINSETKFTTLYTPQQSTAIEDTTIPNNLQIAPHNQLIVPQSTNTWRWQVTEPLGIAKIYLILSIKPFDSTLKLIEQQPTAKLEEQQIINLPQPLAITQAILQDLHNSSAVAAEIIPDQNAVYALNVNNWIGLKFIYDVV